MPGEIDPSFAEQLYMERCWRENEGGGMSGRNYTPYGSTLADVEKTEKSRGHGSLGKVGN